jgi:hypothetical protein
LRLSEGISRTGFVWHPTEVRLQAEADVKESIRVKRCAIAEATEISLPAKEMTDRVGAFLVILRAREAQLVKDEEAYRTVLAEINDVSTNKKTLTSVRPCMCLLPDRRGRNVRYLPEGQRDDMHAK